MQYFGNRSLSLALFSADCLTVSNFFSLVAPLNTSNVVKPCRLPNSISVSNLDVIKSRRNIQDEDNDLTDRQS